MGYAVLDTGIASRGITTTSGLNVGVVPRAEFEFARSALRMRDLLRITNEATIKRRRKIPAAIMAYISKESISKEWMITTEDRRCGGGPRDGEGEGLSEGCLRSTRDLLGASGSTGVRGDQGQTDCCRWVLIPVFAEQPRLELKLIHHSARQKRTKGRSGRCRSWKPIEN